VADRFLTIVSGINEMNYIRRTVVPEVYLEG